MDDLLLQKYNDYIRLKNCKAEYLLSNGMVVTFTYKEENFIHLLGLHKLTDIQLIQLFNDKSNKKVQTKYIISRIKKNKFTDVMVKASVFYSDIASRYENFSYGNLTTLTYTDAVINFNPTLINSKIKSDYLLFEKKANNEYAHLGIAKDSHTHSKSTTEFFSNLRLMLYKKCSYQSYFLSDSCTFTSLSRFDFFDIALLPGEQICVAAMAMRALPAVLNRRIGLLAVLAECDCRQHLDV